MICKYYNCTSLLDVYCYAVNVSPTSKRNPFSSSNYTNATLHVPAVSVETYKAARYWKSFKEIVAIGDVTIGDANGDGVVDVADVVAVVNIILKGGNVNPARIRAILEANGFIF